MKRTNIPICVHGLEPYSIFTHPKAFHLWYPSYRHLNSNPRIPWTLYLHSTVVLATCTHQGHWISAPALLWISRIWLIDFELWWSQLAAQRGTITKVYIYIKCIGKLSPSWLIQCSMLSQPRLFAVWKNVLSRCSFRSHVCASHFRACSVFSNSCQQCTCICVSTSGNAITVRCGQVVLRVLIHIRWWIIGTEGTV